MKTNMKHKYLGIAALALGLSFACAAPSEQNAEVSDGTGPDAGAELWAQNCIRCHNLRPPDSYSAEQWGVIVHHMRVRASLTAREHRAILRFLQNGF
jgi:mono/diheme cytochrome c family protein